MEGLVIVMTIITGVVFFMTLNYIKNQKEQMQKKKIMYEEITSNLEKIKNNLK